MLLSVPGSAIERSALVPARGVTSPSQRTPASVAVVVRPPTVLLVLGTLITTLLAAPVVLAQETRASRSAAAARPAQERKRNDNAPMILGGYPGTSYFDVAQDMRAMLTADPGVRLIVVDAPGGIDTLRDLTLLRGIDLALVSGNVLEFADNNGALGPALKDRISYVASLYEEEVHVLAGPGVAALENLAGKKVAVPPDDGNAEFTARDLLRRVHVEAEIVKVNPIDAIEDLQSGDLGALVLVGGKPSRFVSGLPRDGGLHLLAVPQKPLGEAYSPGNLSADDYPALIPPAQTVETVSVGIIVVANRTASDNDSHQRVAKFVPAFFAAFSDFSGRHRHPKWNEVNLAATLPGWSRFPEAKDWLVTALREQSASVQKGFERFLRARTPAGQQQPSAETRERLFKEYLEWNLTSTPR